MKKTLLALMILAVSASVSFAERGDRDGNWKRGGRDGGMRKEMKAEMRAMHKGIKQMGKAIRDETDEAKKAELIADLRVKLNEIADKMQAKGEERLTKAEQRLEKLKSKIEESKNNRDAMIDEKIERIISGKGPKHQGTDAFKNHPYAKGGHGRGMRDGSGAGEGMGGGRGAGHGEQDGSGPGSGRGLGQGDRDGTGPGGGVKDGSGPGCADASPKADEAPATE